MTQKYRKELTPNITFQPNKIFVRNDLFEKIITSCKATNLEFLKLKEKLVLCLYEQELISMSKKLLKEEKIFTQHDVENKQLKEENEKLRKEESEEFRKEKSEKLRKEESEKLRKKESEKFKKENEELRKNNVVKEIKETIGKPKELKSLEEDKNTTDSYLNWFDKNKFNNILAIIDSNKFNYRHKIGEFSYIEIKDLVINIKNNTISETSAKKGLNALSKKKTHPLNNDDNANAKTKKNSINTKKPTNEIKDGNKNMLLEYMGDVDDKLFKEYCDGKNFNSFLNEFDCATNEEDKEKTS